MAPAALGAWQLDVALLELERAKALERKAQGGRGGLEGTGARTNTSSGKARDIVGEASTVVPTGPKRQEKRRYQARGAVSRTGPFRWQVRHVPQLAGRT